MTRSPNTPDTSPPESPETDGAAPPQKLLTFSSGGWVLLLSAFFTLVAAGLVLYPLFMTGFRRPLGDGKNVESYGFDLSNLTIPRGELVASGNPKDQIDAIPTRLVETMTPREVQKMRENERIRFLVPGDRVIGVVINGEARAYPVRVLAFHELVNDVVQGVPIAVSWSPLCESAVVWDRRIDGEEAAAVEFGVSGLLVDSNSVFYDRRGEAKGESLWPQLQLGAVSGPAAGKKMKLLPYTLTTWEEWTSAHEETRVLAGLRRRKREYGKEPYNIYLYQDDVKFPVEPLWTDPQIRRMTPVVVTSEDGGRTWVARRTTEAGAATRPAGEGSVHRLHTLLFAWYAQHRDVTDWSAIKP